VKITKGPIILVVLAVVLVGIWMLIRGITPIRKTVKQVTTRSTTVKITSEELKKKAEETALSLSQWLEKRGEMEKMLTYHEGPRDPLAPPTKKKAEPRKPAPIKLPPLLLKGIAYDETQPLALINDRVVKEGDTVQGARIGKINFDQVVVWYRSKKFVIKLIEWGKKS